MASPQKENGYTAIANEIMEALCKIRIPGEERQVLDAILRKTYGWNKCEDAIALSQFVEMTGLLKTHVIRAINGLLSKKVITVTQKGNEPAKVYKFNKDFEKWTPLPKKVTLPKKVMVVTENGNASLPKKGTTKPTTTKPSLTKENIYIVEIVSYLNEKTGKKFNSKSKVTKSHINARLTDGFKIEDFRQVIDNKCSQWLNDSKMSAFLRPETLFGTKFESYLNELPVDPALSQFSEKSQRTIRNLQNWRPPSEG